jgi:hypothetical protein
LQQNQHTVPGKAAQAAFSGALAPGTPIALPPRMNIKGPNPHRRAHRRPCEVASVMARVTLIVVLIALLLSAVGPWGTTEDGPEVGNTVTDAGTPLTPDFEPTYPAE